MLELMKKDITPLLVFIGDFAKVNLSRKESFSEAVTPLCYKDAKIIAVDMVSKEVKGMNDLKTVTFLTQGDYLSFNDLIAFDEAS